MACVRVCVTVWIWQAHFGTAAYSSAVISRSPSGASRAPCTGLCLQEDDAHDTVTSATVGHNIHSSNMSVTANCLWPSLKLVMDAFPSERCFSPLFSPFFNHLTSWNMGLDLKCEWGNWENYHELLFNVIIRLNWFVDDLKQFYDVYNHKSDWAVVSWTAPGAEIHASHCFLRFCLQNKCALTFFLLSCS